MFEKSTHPDMPEIMFSENDVHKLLKNLNPRKATKANDVLRQNNCATAPLQQAMSPNNINTRPTHLQEGRQEPGS